MSWTVETLDEAPVKIIDGDRGKNYPTQNELLDEGYCLFLSATNVTKDGFAFDKCQFITEQKDHALRKGRVQRNDVILTTRGTLGNVAFYSEAVPFDHMRINSGMVTIQAEPDKLRPRYLYYFLKSELFQSQVRALQSGAAQPQLPIRDIKKIKISYPDPTTQDHISDRIGSYDDLIKNNRRRIALLEEAARLLYREWFVHFRFPGHEHVKIIDGIPEGWRKVNLGDLVSIKKGRNITKSTIEPGDVPVVAGGLNPAYFHNKSNTAGPVITISASGANAGYVNFYHVDVWASDCSYIDSKSTDHSYYFYLAMRERQSQITSMQVGAAQPHVYPKDLARIEMVHCDDSLLTTFSSLVEPNFIQIKNLEAMNGQLSKARDLLLPRLMDGRLEVAA